MKSRKKKILLNSLLGSGSAAPSFYVSESGDGVGTEADPFGVSEFLAALSTIPSGSIIYFNKGDEFEIGEIDADKPLTFNAYGTGDDPILTGSEDASGLVWTDELDGTFSTPMATAPLWVFASGISAKWAQSSWIEITSTPSGSTVGVLAATINALSGSIVGAKLRMIEEQWRPSVEYTVTAYDSGTGVITIDGTYGSNAVYLALFDQQQFLTSNGDWWYDDVNDKLYYKSDSNPSGLDIRVCTYRTGVNALASGVSFQNLTFKHYEYAAIYSLNDDGDAITVNNCTFTDIHERGVVLSGCNNTTISDCTFTRMGRDGIVLIGDNNTISNNEITTVGMDSNYPLPSVGSSSGSGVIMNNSDTCVCSNNTISEVAYSGILFSGVDLTIHQNVISDYGKRFRDGGGIYTSGNSSGGVNNSNTISQNFVSDAATTSEGGLTTDVILGVYIDNKTELTTVIGNVIEDSDVSVYCNWDTKTTTIQDNIMFNPVISCVKFIEDEGQAVLFTNNSGNVLTGNIMVVKSTSQYCLLVNSYDNVTTFNPYSDGGSADDNYYIQPYQNPFAGYAQIAGGLITGYGIVGWQTLMGQDADSVAINNYLTPPAYPAFNTLLIKNATASPVNGTALDHYTDVDQDIVTDYTIQAFSGLVLLAEASSDKSLFFAAASSQYVSFGTDSDIEFERTDPLSIAFWFKIPANPSGSQLILSKIAAGAPGYKVQVNATGKLLFEIRNTPSTNRYSAETNLDYADNTWHHCLITKPAIFADTRIWIDGISVAITELDNLSSSCVTTEPLTLSWIASFFDGYIDELAIWDTDEAANIGAIFNGGMTHDMNLLTAPPLHYWKLEDDYEDSGSSSTNLDGTPVNSPTFSTDVP